MDDTRFAGILGKEYNLFALSVPHHDEFQEAITKLVQARFAVSTASTISVFEAGAGTGITTVRLLDAEPRIKVIAVDNEQKTLNQAREILATYGDRVTYKEGDVLDVLKEQKDASFDVFASAYVLHNLPPEYRTGLIPEIYRILKPNGYFINADKYAYDDPAEQQAALEKQLSDFGVYDDMGRSDLRAEWTAHYLEDEKTKITESEQITILESVGFVEMRREYRKGMEAIITAVKPS